jgi:hypothetical protein
MNDMDIRQAFLDLEWHDAMLQEIHIDRRRPGDRDEVVLTIQWPDERTQRMRFLNCYGMVANMNFGVVAKECILTADCESDAPELSVLREKWARMGVDLPHLLSFEVETNSTASRLRLFAEAFELTDV